MSGSHDRPPGGPPGGLPGGYGYPPRRGQEPDPFDPYEDVATGPPAGGGGPGQPPYPTHLQVPPHHRHQPGWAHHEPQPAAARQRPHPTLEAPPRTDQPAVSRKAEPEPVRVDSPIVPARSVTSRSLTLVISIMCFLACLTLGAVYTIHQSAEAWLKDIASEVTVQVEPRDKEDVEKSLKDVSAFLGAQAGIRSVKPLGLEEQGLLLEPWLGQTDALKSLSVPRLIAIEIDRSTPPDFQALRETLQKQFKGVTLDDHRHWQQQIRTVTRSFALGGFAILALVAAATIAIIVSAARSALAWAGMRPRSSTLKVKMQR